MPSSHGGGHGGGGGGGSHGGFSGGGSHGRGGSSTPGFSTKRPVPGGKRFDYVNSYGVASYFYYCGTPTRVSSKAAIIGPAFMAIFGLIFMSIFISVMIPRKLSDGQCVPTAAYFEDTAGVISDEATLNATFTAFYEKTGVQPYLYTFRDTEFPSRYGTLGNTSIQDYAWQLYIDRFEDEGHWLIVYCYSDNPDGWYWCDMSGDNANGITDGIFDDFQKDMQRKLYKTGGTPQNAIVESMANATDNAMKFGGSGDSEGLLFVALFLVVWEAVCVGSVVSTIKRAKVLNDYCDYRDSGSGDGTVDAGGNGYVGDDYVGDNGYVGGSDGNDNIDGNNDITF